MSSKTKRVVFGVETEPFTETFNKATAEQERTKHATKMRLACLYDEGGDEYHYFTEDEASSLIQYLQNAGEIVSFNGTNFDILILRRHYGLKGRIPKNGKHIDIHEIMSKKAGFRVSLNKAAKLSLNEKKHALGKSMTELDIEKLKIACRSDVEQTYRLWKLHKQNKLQIPERTAFYERYDRDEEEGLVGPGQHMPQVCPFCHDVGSLELEEHEDEIGDMTEGQLAEYMAGTWGSAYCTTCNALFNWEM